MLLVRSRSNYRVQALPNIKSFVELIENRFCTHFLFVLFARTLRTRAAFSHASADHRFVFLLFLFSFFSSFPFLLFFRTLSLSLSVCSSLFGWTERSDDTRGDLRHRERWWPIKDLPWNKFADIFFWYEQIVFVRMEEILIPEMNCYPLLRKRWCVVIRCNG